MKTRTEKREVRTNVDKIIIFLFKKDLYESTAKKMLQSSFILLYTIRSRKVKTNGGKKQVDCSVKQFEYV
jgi:hypothetical protein